MGDVPRGRVGGEALPRGKQGETAAEALARARTDPAAAAVDVLLKCLLGQADDRRGQVQRQAALDILGGALWQHLDDAQLDAHLERVIAEVERRRGAKP